MFYRPLYVGCLRLVYSDSFRRKLTQIRSSTAMLPMSSRPRRPFRRRIAVLVLAFLSLTQPAAATAYVPTSSGNALVEAMLRMMELFGLIDRDHLALGSTFLPGYGGLLGYGGLPTGAMGGIPGYPGMAGLGGWPGMGANPMMAPGMMQPGMIQPGMMQPGMIQPGKNPWTGQQNPFGYPSSATQGALDGTWVLNKRGIAIIRGSFARLYLSREHYQDFEIRYDQRHLWLTPRRGGSASRYQYRMHKGRMIVRDDEGNYLLLRRTG